MIEYLRVGIIPSHLDGTNTKKFKIRIKEFGKDLVERNQLCEPDELVSFFDQIFDCAKQEILKILKPNKENKEDD